MDWIHQRALVGVNDWIQYRIQYVCRYLHWVLWDRNDVVQHLFRLELVERWIALQRGCNQPNYSWVVGSTHHADMQHRFAAHCMYMCAVMTMDMRL